MKKKRKPALTPWSLGSLPLTEVPVKNQAAPLDRTTLLKQLRDEEEQKHLAADPVHQSIVKQSKTTQALRKLSIEFWSRPIEQIIADGDCESARDVTFNVPALTDWFTFEDAKAAFNKWFATTFAKSGYDLTEQGGQRLVRFGLANAKFGADMSNAAAWQTAFEHLKDLEVFQPGDFAKVSRPVAAPAPKPTLADIESLNLSGDENDARRAKKIAQELMYTEASPLHREWMASLYANFNFVPTDADLTYIYNKLFPASNWSYIAPRSFDKARRAMVAQGRWSENLLTRDEQLSIALEQSGALSNMGFHEKQQVFSQMKRMREPA